VVQKECDTVQTSVLFEIRFEETRCLHVYTHGREDNGEIILVPIMDILRWALYKAGLTADLGGDLWRVDDANCET
jgi:hypothetical protein